MSTHTVASDAHPLSIQIGKSSEDSLGQLFGDIAVHIITSVIRLLCGVDVKTGTGAEIVCIILACNVQATLTEISQYRRFPKNDIEITDDVDGICRP